VDDNVDLLSMTLMLLPVLIREDGTSYATKLPIMANNHVESPVNKIKPSYKTDKFPGTYNVISNQDEMGEDVGMMVHDCHRAVLGSGNDEVVDGSTEDNAKDGQKDGNAMELDNNGTIVD